MVLDRPPWYAPLTIAALITWALLLPLAGSIQAAGPDRVRPNVVILMGDDWSWPHAGALGDPVVKTPTFDRLAAEGVLFENAFVSAPSCTPSRYAIATGQWHWRLESGMNLGGMLPRGVSTYPTMLDQHGYKVGYMRKGGWPRYDKESTDPFGLRYKSFEEFISERKGDEPFCFWFGSIDPHRPYEWQSGLKSGMSLEDVEVPPYLPDNETIRTDLLDYYREVQRFDRDAGEIVAKLESMGLLDNTIVIMSGDNGMPFPRAKATLYDAGTRVPLAIRWGSAVKGGRSVSDFVSLCDLAPTILEAVGLRPPDEMTGRTLMPILESDKSGQIDPERTHVLTGMERHVYRYPGRAIRTSDYLYIRNFNVDDWRTGEGTWPSRDRDFSFNIDPAPSKWYIYDNRQDPRIQPFYHGAFDPRPEEELFDLRKDPDQMHNVADDTAYRDVREELGLRLERELRGSKDPRRITAGYLVLTIEGWAVNVSHGILQAEDDKDSPVIKLLRTKLREIAGVVPEPPLTHLRRVPIWMGDPNSRGPRGEYHPNPDWLQDTKLNPAKAKSVEFDNASFFVEKSPQQPMMVLHELAHAYHDQVLGFDHPEIKNAYRRAAESGLYDDLPGNKGNGKRAYAMTNEKEYFAEATEAFFGRNDFYPFNQAELSDHDPSMYELLKRIWAGDHGRALR